MASGMSNEEMNLWKKERQERLDVLRQEKETAREANKEAKERREMIGKITGFIANANSRIMSRVGGATGALAATTAIPTGIVSSLVAPIGDAFMGIVGKITGAMSPIISMVDKMNPALVQMFEFAINDLMAVFGDILQPILAAVTGVVRQLADTFLTMKPAIDPIIQIIVKMIGVFGKMIEPIAKLMVPVLQLVAAVLDNVVIPILEFFVEKLQWLAKAVLGVVNEIVKAYNELADTKVGRGLGLKKFNLLNFDDMQKRSSQGMAIRETQRTSAEELGARTREGSFAQTQRSMLEIMTKTATNTSTLVQQISALVGINEEQVRQLAKQLGYNLE